jgi:hypothetical protein
MVFIAAFIGTVLLSGFASAIPRPQASPTLSTVAAPTASPLTTSYVHFYATDATQLQWIFLDKLPRRLKAQVVPPSLPHRALEVMVLAAVMDLVATVPVVVLAASGGRRRRRRLLPLRLQHTDSPHHQLMALVRLTGEVQAMTTVSPVSQLALSLFEI